MLTIDDNLLTELGLGSLPAEERKALLAHLLETLELRVGMKLAQGLDDEQLDEFEALLPIAADNEEVRLKKEQAALKWLETHFPNYREVVAQELETLKSEVRRDAPQILAATAERNATT